MKLKKVASVVLALTMVAGLAACGSSSDGDSKSSDSKTSDSKASESSGNETEKTTLTMWSWSPITRTCDKMIEAFEKENPDIKIEFTYYNYDPEYLSALSAAAASDNLPDIIGLQPGSLTAQYADYLMDYSSYAQEEWGDNWKDNYPDMIADQIQMGNKPGDEGNYILPVEAQVISIVYNKNVFEKYGLDIPNT